MIVYLYNFFREVKKGFLILFYYILFVKKTCHVIKSSDCISFSKIKNIFLNKFFKIVKKFKLLMGIHIFINFFIYFLFYEKSFNYLSVFYCYIFEYFVVKSFFLDPFFFRNFERNFFCEAQKLTI